EGRVETITEPSLARAAFGRTTPHDDLGARIRNGSSQDSYRRVPGRMLIVKTGVLPFAHAAPGTFRALAVAATSEEGRGLRHAGRRRAAQAGPRRLAVPERLEPRRPSGPRSPIG